MVMHVHIHPARAPGAGMARLRPGLVHAGFSPVALGVGAPIPPPVGTDVAPLTIKSRRDNPVGSAVGRLHYRR